MIRLELDEQDAVDLHYVIERLRHMDGEVLRGPSLALSGALRAAGWRPTEHGGTWEKRPTGRRR